MVCRAFGLVVCVLLDGVLVEQGDRTVLAEVSLTLRGVSNQETQAMFIWLRIRVTGRRYICSLLRSNPLMKHHWDSFRAGSCPFESGMNQTTTAIMLVKNQTRRTPSLDNQLGGSNYIARCHHFTTVMWSESLSRRRKL